MNGNCVVKLGMRDYPDKYCDNCPLLCVSPQGQAIFAEWMQSRTGLEYKVADDAAYASSLKAKVLNRNSRAFRVFLPSTSGGLQ